jgi:hypothetical protein
MATQYTSILKLALPTEGELSGTWGDVVNDNITSMVEEAIAGRAVIDSWTANGHTLTTADGTTAEARCAMLEFTDTNTDLTGNASVICPTASKIYIAKNATGAGYSVTLKTSAGTGIAVPDGETMFLFCDGTNVVEAVTSVKTLKIADGVQVNTILDEDNMASDSATALATQQSIKAYVDAQITAQDLDIAGDSGTGAVDLDSESLTVAGTTDEIETSASGQTITVGLPSAVIVTTSVTTPTVQVTNINANDGSTSATIADSTGVMTIASSVLTTTDINAGTIDDTIIGGSTAAAGTFTTATTTTGVVTDTISERTATSGVTIDGVVLKDSGITATGGGSLTGTWSDLGTVTTVDINGGTIDGTVIGGASAAAGTFTTATATTGNITTVNATTVDTTNIEVTNVKAKDGTASATIADSTGVMTIASSVLTTADINGGTIDGTVIGGASAAAGTFTTLNTSGAVVFNEAGADVDFRIESDTNANAFFVEGSSGNVIIGSTSNIVKRTDTGSNYGGAAAPQLTLKDNAGSFGQLTILNGNGSGSNAPNLSFGHKNSAGNYTYGGTISLVGSDTTAGSEEYAFSFSTQSGGGNASERMRITAGGNVGIGTTSPAAKLSVDGSAIFNESGADVDFRVESDTNDHALFVDAGNSRVGIGTSSPSCELDIAGTGAVKLPSGTTAERPGSPVAGMIRQNTDDDVIETYNGTAWVAVGDQRGEYTVEYLVVAGGGGSGAGPGGGGGAGGYRCSVLGESSGGGLSAEPALNVNAGVIYTVTVGSGGAGSSSTGAAGSQGGNTVFGSVTSTGGGGGGGYNVANPGSGGSGGGMGSGTGSGGAGTTGQGFAGGNGAGVNNGTAGGGGAGSVGANAPGVFLGSGGDGGVGVSSAIAGTSVERAGGGGGAAHTGGNGGNATGGGGVGGAAGTGDTNNGSANTGGGGGGVSSGGTTGSSGGSGIVIIRYAGVQKGTGGTVTSSGDYTIHTFTSSGTYTA